MSPNQLLAELRRRGVDLVVVDDFRLHWYAAPGALTPELERALHAAQAELIRAIRQAAVESGQTTRILVQPGPPGHISYAQLAFWRWLVVTGRVGRRAAGPPEGAYAQPVANWQRRQLAAR